MTHNVDIDDNNDVDLLATTETRRLLFVQESVNHCDWHVHAATYFRETVR